MAFYSCVVFLTLLYQVKGFEQGAPFSTCFTQYPKHGKGTQESAVPFEMKFTPSSYQPGQEVQIDVRDTTGGTFMGIQIAARRKTGNADEIVGRFVEFPADKIKAFNCFGGYQNMLTHRNKKTIPQVTFKWKAPDQNVGMVTFTTTFVRSYEVFWTGVKFNLGVNSLAQVQAPKYAAKPLGTQTTSIDFDACGDTKGCFYYPRQCSGSDCIAAATYLHRPATNDFLFELFSNHDSDYVSIGFSHDEWMGNDLTMSCTGNNGDMSVQEGFNPLQYNERFLNLFSSSHEVKYQDGKLQCRFVLPESFIMYRVLQNATSAQTMETTWSMMTDYYLMMAWGHTMPESSVIGHHHEFPATTFSKVDLSEKVITLSSSFHLLVRAHGAIMMVAWILLTGIVTIVARHYREWLPRTRWFGTKVWFQIHRELAVIVFLLTVAGIILIFVHGDGVDFNERVYAKDHACVGLTVLACVCVQIIAGMIRPGGDHKLRPLFNWGHWFMGQATHILSAATMFLAFDMKYFNSDLKQFGLIVMGVWVGVSVVWGLVFEIIARRRKSDESPYSGTDGNQFKLEGKDSNNDHSTMDILLLALYVFSMVALCVAALVAFLLY